MSQKRNNNISASRMSSFMSCMRKHYWEYEIRLQQIEKSVALRIGSAWARAMEARWSGASYEDALAASIPEGIDLDEYACAMISSMLAAYYEIYSKRKEPFKSVTPEVKFERDLGNGFKTKGFIDGLGVLRSGQQGIVESKTTSSPLDAHSDYWLRLAFNLQILQYIAESREIGWDVAKVFYDVAHKPKLKPAQIINVDEDGVKIVLDKHGDRAKLKGGKWRQSQSIEDGLIYDSRQETADEFCDRIYRDALDRKYFYFARREIPVIDQQVESFILQRDAIIRLIVFMRAAEAGLERPEDAWPRNVSESTCKFCNFKSFCLQNISPDLNHPPQGFKVWTHPAPKGKQT